MCNLTRITKRRITVLFLIAFQFFASASSLLLAQSYPGDPQSENYDPSQSYNQQDNSGYLQSGSGSGGIDALRSRCSGPDAAPECASLAGGEGSGMPSLGGASGVPQIYSDDQGSAAGRSPYTYPYLYPLSRGNYYNPRPYLLKPEPPTEFQKFIYSSVGQRLPIFGANLFINAPSTFAPVDRAPVPADYVVGPGDQLLIRGWGQVDINVRTTVDRSGNIYISKVGEVNVTGVKYSDLLPYLKGVISRTFRNFDLSVSMGQLRSIQIFVVGQARHPGSYTVSSLSTLVSVVFYSGGPLNTGSMRRIQLRRSDKVAVEFDLYDLLLNGDKSRDVTLLPGDVIFIPPVGPQVAMVGSVNTPAIYELKESTTLAEAVKLSGGLTALSDDNKATVERVEQGDHQTFRRVEDFPLNDSGLTKNLQNGDIVRIAPMLPRFEDTVTLRGNVAWPGRYPWHDGMRIRDLIPSKEALLTRDFWRQQNPVYSAAGEVRLPSNVAPTGGNANGGKTLSGTQETDGYPQQVADQRSGTSYDQEDPSSYAQIAANNKGADPSSVVESSARQATYAASTLSAGETKLRNEIKATAPEINWDYAVIQRINKVDLSTTLVPFNLGKAILENEPSQNVVLYPGDVVTIFSQQDIKIPVEKQVKFVRLEGEFAASGVYRVEPGETLRQLVQRVGGLTSNAYLFGSEFTRESTRERQQQQLNRIVSDLDVQVERNATTGANAAASPESAALLGPSLEAQRRLVEKLKQLRPTGRIVLELPGPRATIQDLPNMTLEDGDRFVVPYRPASIEVLGSVYNANAFIWSSEKRMSDYLRDAGGPNRNADKKHIFILRADGAVISNNSGSSFWGGGIESYRLEPGDAVVVPETLWKGNVQRNLREWTQIFSQMALGAASIAVLSGL